MKAEVLEKVFNPKDFEDRIYSFWMEKGSFQPSDESSTPFVIVIPPPNVTGVLHMGHGLNNALQDIIIRFQRMLGRPTLWVPGTDHAGIATQNVVEKRLRGRGLSRHDLGREKFIEETWKVKVEHHTIITRQLQKIGASCDWGRERFTMDEGLSRAVREVFVTLYERGLVYRGNYLVNWCTSCGTAISDDEVEHEESQGKLYHYVYPLEDGAGTIPIATTRPETMLGDTAVAVHPEDSRYAAFVGKTVVLPLTGRKIPVVADAYVDREFGSGVVKVTPAHDQNDWEIAERHNLEKINILNPDGTLNDNVPEKYRNLDVAAARKAVDKDMQDGGFFIKVDDHNHQIGHCYRCSTVIEPFLSEQWFVKMKPLAEKALAAWKNDDIRFYPKKWENTYKHWLENIRDWCISRQLWWGHRIPVWYCTGCDNLIVSREDPESCPSCGGGLTQDEDVLDTWFSSMLWPFSTLGWPENTDDLTRFYPTSALVTGYDIIFFWVSRMIMAGLEFKEEVPFRDIYITGLVRDKQGRKMSKSLGNGIDPLEIVDEYGADALKFTLTFLAAQGQDILIDKETFKLGSKFANKIWNAARYLIMNMEGRTFIPEDQIQLNDVDKWIYHRLNETVKLVRSSMEVYRINEAAQACYEFFWNDFCDWYIEGSKLSLSSQEDGERDRGVSLLALILEEALRLLHPYVSFITEEIYQKLPQDETSVFTPFPALITAPYPEEDKAREEKEIDGSFAILQDLVSGIRTLRSEFTVPPAKKIVVHVKTDRDFPATGFISRNKGLIQLLIGGEALTISEEDPNNSGAVQVAGNGFIAYVFIRDVIDVPRMIEKLEKDIGKMDQQREKTDRKLSNDQFLQNAPVEVVEKEKAILEELESRTRKIEGYIRELA